MKKSQGFAVTAALAAGFVFHASPPSTPRATQAAGTPAIRQEKSIASEGPWAASCRYWQPERGYHPGKPARSSASSESGIAALSSALAAASDKDESACPGEKPGDSNRWGLPADEIASNVKLHAITAVLPDPLHTHLALEFDREIDALIMAAGDNSYVPSFFWLPWRQHGSLLTEDGATSSGSEQDDESREKQPGLIIFKHVPKAATSRETNQDIRTADYWDVVYVFLVGQSPAAGMNGAQLSLALQYELDLKHIQPATSLTMRTPQPAQPGASQPTRLAIVGSTATGSASSLREGIVAALAHAPLSKPIEVDVAASTSTQLAADLFSGKEHTYAQEGDAPGSKTLSFNYVSFNNNAQYDLCQFKNALRDSGYGLERMAILAEDGTLFGEDNSQLPPDPKVTSEPKYNPSGCRIGGPGSTGEPFIVRYPREISLLRNARSGGGGNLQDESSSAGDASPFLHLNLRDGDLDDSVPQFSRAQTPFSQEAQLMVITRQLERNRAQFIAITGSDILDQMYLAKFLHRALPDAHLVFIGGDELFERDVENVPYIGTITLSSNSLITLTSSRGFPGPYRAFADSTTEAYFNAASYTFWDGSPGSEGAPRPYLANYHNIFEPKAPPHASLWATVIGTNGYYPLAIVNDCASNTSGVLPMLSKPGPKASSSEARTVPCSDQSSFTSTHGWLSDLKIAVTSGTPDTRPYRYPSYIWQILCILISMLCLTHIFFLSVANFWSPTTTDLAIRQNDQPHRRCMYIFIGTCMLFTMTVVTAYPLFPTFLFIHPNLHTMTYSILTMLAGVAALAATFIKTWPYLLWNHDGADIEASRSERFWIGVDQNAPFFFNLAAAVSTLITCAIWISICQTEVVHGVHSYVGIFFSYRCLHPDSLVSPLSPTILILTGWYIWSICQVLRLRFSDAKRPRLPNGIPGTGPMPLYVSDYQLSRDQHPSDSSLFTNITVLLITRECLLRFYHRAKAWLTALLLAVFFSILGVLVFRVHLESFDRFAWAPPSWWNGRLHAPTGFEFLLGVLAFPLVIVAAAGWLRLVLVWGSLRSHLLRQLEMLPIRDAFTRLKGASWMSMMRQGGITEHWLDMARSSESIRQMLNEETFFDSISNNNLANAARVDLSANSEVLDQHIADLIAQIENHRTCKLGGDPLLPIGKPPQVPKCSELTPRDGLDAMEQIELDYARFAESLLKYILIPYWEDQRVALVDGEEQEALPIRAHPLPKEEALRPSHTPLQLHTSAAEEVDFPIRLAEEFLAIRYVSLIRAVLVNMKYLITFISLIFVVTIIAWNSYPFQPRQLVDEAFTGLLLILGGGVIWVFAQMHRDPILSRITDTKPNQLGIDFYLRIATFGAVPVFTWLAYQFPEYFTSILKVVKPGLDAFK